MPTTPGHGPLEEANFDGLVGPSHNYAGLSPGNVASAINSGQPSSPKKAALQGLHKAMTLAEQGRHQYILPPHPRPHLEFLSAVGFPAAEGIVAAAHASPHTLATAYSASFMWAANAATVTPSTDTNDGRAHFTPANLIANAHRAIEPAYTTALLRAIFRDEKLFGVHDPLPASLPFGDEGAANHTRLHTPTGFCHLFVFGRGYDDQPAPKRFPARQTRLASETIARRHQIDPDRCVYAHQRADAIDAGVFHNDVICVGNADALLIHEQALYDHDNIIDQITNALGQPPRVRVVTSDEVPIADAVRSYLFNGQLLGEPGQPQTLVCPTECQDTPTVASLLEKLVKESFLERAHVIDVRESMRNGGGPACLRLRVPLTQLERDHIVGRVRLDRLLHDDLADCINTTYRDQLTPADLADPAFAEESLDATRRLTELLQLNDLIDPTPGPSPR